MNIEIHCLESWPREFTKGRKSAPFRSSYAKTLVLLDDELKRIGAKTVVLQMALKQDEIRLDGKMRAGVEPSHPGIILSFETKTGTVQFPCDRFRNWKDNLRAIALTLEHLRAVDRYGVTSKAEQYAGWTRLPAPGENGFGSSEAAREFLRKVIGEEFSRYSRDVIRRMAEQKSHPDRGGTDATFKMTQKALAMLGY